MVVSSLLEIERTGYHSGRKRGRSKRCERVLQQAVRSRLVSNFYPSAECLMPDYSIPYASCFLNSNYGKTTFVLASEEGTLSVFNCKVRNRGRNQRQRLRPTFSTRAHNNCIFDVASQDNSLLSASADKSIRKWDSQTLNHVDTFIGHKGSVKTVVPFHCSPFQFISAGRDGNTFIWDSRHSSEKKSNGPVLSLKGIHNHQGRSFAVSAAAIKPDNRTLITAGATDGLVKIWDLRFGSAEEITKIDLQSGVKCSNDHKHVYQSNRPRGITSLCVSGTKLLVTYMGTDIVMYSIEEEPLVTRVFNADGYSCDSFYVKSCFSPDGDYIVSGGNSTYIWKCREPSEPVVLGYEEVTSVAWPQFETVLTLSDTGVCRAFSPDYDNRKVNSNCIDAFKEYNFKRSKRL